MLGTWVLVLVVVVSEFLLVVSLLVPAVTELCSCYAGADYAGGALLFSMWHSQCGRNRQQTWNLTAWLCVKRAARGYHLHLQL